MQQPDVAWGVVAAGGAVGALARHAVGLVLPMAQIGSEVGDLGVVVVNLVGAFLLAVLVSRPMSVLAGLFFRTGVLGAFTTFSAMAVQATDLGWFGGPYLVLLVGAGWLAAWGGLRIGVHVYGDAEFRGEGAP